MKLTVDDILRWWKFVETRGDDCWLWLGGSRGEGYGAFKLNGKVIDAHRISFFIKNEYLPIVVRHSCDNRRCVNPDHLLPGDYKDNSRDAVERGQQARGERVGTSKLSPENVIDIRQRVRRGETQTSISELYGVSRRAISHIVKGATWAHVNI